MNSNKELIFYVFFENYLNRYDVLIVTKDDKTYAFNQLNFKSEIIIYIAKLENLFNSTHRILPHKLKMLKN